MFYTALGLVLILLPFVLLFIYTARQLGWIDTSGVFVGTMLVMVIVRYATQKISGDGDDDK